MSAMLRSDSEISPCALAAASSSACVRRQLERGGVALRELLAFLGLDQLADGEHAHVAEQRVRHVVVVARAAAAPLRQDHVDVVIGQDQAPGTPSLP